MPVSVEKSDGLPAFLAALEAPDHNARVTNPYRLPHRSSNLSAYLDAVFSQSGRRMLLVGEALGYRGGLLTGIPFSSGALLCNPHHAFLRRLAPQLTLVDHAAEATASIVWNGLLGRRTVPLFWNAFPFHPHREAEPLSNRAPVRTDVDEGLAYLRALARLYNPQLIAGVGRRGTEAARRAFPEVQIFPLRHPSYGGKSEFLLGLNQLYRRRVSQTVSTRP